MFSKAITGWAQSEACLELHSSRFLTVYIPLETLWKLNIPSWDNISQWDDSNFVSQFNTINWISMDPEYYRQVFIPKLPITPTTMHSLIKRTLQQYLNSMSTIPYICIHKDYQTENCLVNIITNSNGPVLCHLRFNAGNARQLKAVLKGMWCYNFGTSHSAMATGMKRIFLNITVAWNYVIFECQYAIFHSERNKAPQNDGIRGFQPHRHE